MTQSQLDFIEEQAASVPPVLTLISPVPVLDPSREEPLALPHPRPAGPLIAPEAPLLVGAVALADASGAPASPPVPSAVLCGRHGHK